MFVVCGEALYDVFAGRPSDTGLILSRMGGSPFNVAIGLARLRVPVSYFGTLSRDVFGERLLGVLRAEGVRTDTTQRSDAPTTLAIVALDEHGVPSYSFRGEHGADRDLTPAALAAVPTDALAFHFGSYSMVVEPAATTLRALVEREHRRRMIVYDPNVRLHVEASTQRWRDVLRWMIPRTHLLKVSQEDLGVLCPGVALRVLATQWLAEGVRLVVVTRGGTGAVAWTAKGQASRPAPPVTVIDTVGAGGAFHAAMLAWLAERHLLDPPALASLSTPALEAMLDFACLAASITCSKRGAQLPRRADLMEALEAKR